MLGEDGTLTLAWRSVIGAGFALPRDAGRRPALRPSPRSFRGFGKGRKWCRFRAPARCRSETGALKSPRASFRGFGKGSEVVQRFGPPAGRDAVGPAATYAAGHERVRPGEEAAADSDRGIRCWERMGHSRGMARHRRRYRAPARCRSETGAPAVPAFVPRLRQRQEVAQVSRSRAMPVGDRRSKPSPRSFRGFGSGQEVVQVSQRIAIKAPVREDAGGDRRSGRPRVRSAASAKAGSGAGFALPRDAGRRPALRPSRRSFRGFGKGRKWRRFRAPARCRSETGAPSRPGYRGSACWERMGHSRWHGQVMVQVSRSRAMPVGDRRSSRPRARSAASAKAGSGAGFALPRDAGRRPALRPSPRSFRGFGKGRKWCRFRAPARCRSETGAPAVPAFVPRLRQRQEVVQVSRSRAMPVGDRRSSRPRASFRGRRRFRAPARCRSETGAPAVPALSFRGFGKGRKWCRFRAPARCRSETGAPPRYRSAASAKAGSGAGFALPRDAGRRPALQSPRSLRGFGKGRKWRRFRAPARCRSETGAPVPALLRG